MKANEHVVWARTGDGHLDALHGLHALGLFVHVRVGPAPKEELQAGVEDEHVAGVEAIRRTRDLHQKQRNKKNIVERKVIKTWYL